LASVERNEAASSRDRLTRLEKIMEDSKNPRKLQLTRETLRRLTEQPHRARLALGVRTGGAHAMRVEDSEGCHSADPCDSVQVCTA
jgi:hypothetical protein